MANSFQYLLEYAGVPFVSDAGTVFRIDGDMHETEVKPAVRKYQPLDTLYNVLNEKIPFQYLSDFCAQPQYLGRNVEALPSTQVPSTNPNQQLKIGQYFYPNHASRWSIGRFVASSSQVKAMVSATTGGLTPQTFVMKSAPVGAAAGSESSYTVSTSLYMLPPRPLAELGGDFDGLFMVTLVDERYYWQFKQSSFGSQLDQNTTWATLIGTLMSDLNVIIDPGTIDPNFGQPNTDSQLWTFYENAAFLLDAVAWNIGKAVVRNLDGTYTLQSNTEAMDVIAANRGDAADVIRMAGGDMFSQLTTLKAGDLGVNRNSVCPARVTVTFPQYVIGDDPVPHFVNNRYKNQRPTAWWEDSAGGQYQVTVPILSGGPCVSGIAGNDSMMNFRDTAQALYSGEVQIGSDPLNVSGLTALAMATAQDYWEGQACAALDEVYPGTYAWEPEGFDDILWTYSSDVRQASTRVMRGEWNSIVMDRQHATPALVHLNQTNIPRGVGGHVVAQTWRDSYGTFSGASAGKILAADLTSGAMSVSLTNTNYLPTDHRWRGKVEQEIMLLEGTSGKATVDIVNRGIDNTKQVLHAAGNTLEWLLPNTGYGENLLTLDKGFFGAQGIWTSGGISEYVIQCPARSVLCLAGSGSEKNFNNLDYYSGQVLDFDPSKGSGQQFPVDRLIWLTDRNGYRLISGRRYDGQLVGYSLSGAEAPVYTVNEYPILSGSVMSGMIASGSIYSGLFASGYYSSISYYSGVSNIWVQSGTCTLYTSCTNASGQTIVKFYNGTPV